VCGCMRMREERENTDVHRQNQTWYIMLISFLACSQSCPSLEEEGKEEDRPITRSESNTAYCILEVIQSQSLILNLIGLFSMERQKRPREVNHRLRFEKEEMTLHLQKAVQTHGQAI